VQKLKDCLITYLPVYIDLRLSNFCLSTTTAY